MAAIFRVCAASCAPKRNGRTYLPFHRPCHTAARLAPPNQAMPCLPCLDPRQPVGHPRLGAKGLSAPLRSLVHRRLWTEIQTEVDQHADRIRPRVGYELRGNPAVYGGKLIGLHAHADEGADTRGFRASSFLCYHDLTCHTFCVSRERSGRQGAENTKAALTKSKDRTHAQG